MRVLHLTPSAALRPHVRALLAIESAAGDSGVILPEPGVVLGFRVGAPVVMLDASGKPLPRVGAGMTGLRTSVRRMRSEGSGLTIAVHFSALGASHFVAEPLHELFGTVVPLGDLVEPRAVREVEERLSEATDIDGAAAVVDRFLVQRLAPREDSLVRSVVAGIVEQRGAVRIRDLARAHGTSQDPLEKRFRRVVGASPKQFSKIVRFQAAVSARAAVTTLAALAQAAGYYDQSHMAHDFRSVTGCSPSEFFAQRMP